MSKLQIADAELFYDIQGTGEPLLFIAGMSCDSSFWLPVLPALTAQYQVIRLDNRGIGQSSAPDRALSIQQMVADAIALLNFLGIPKVHLAGHSMGGQIAQELVLAAPEKVQSLMVLSSWAKRNAKFNAVIEMWGNLPDKIDARLYQQVVLPWIFGDSFYARPGVIEQVSQMMLNYPYAPSPRLIYHQSQAILASDTSERLGNIPCPTLVMVGEQDILTPVKFSEQLAQGIANSEFVVIDEAGHGLIAETSEAVTTTMLHFMETVSTGVLSVS
jgi:pimeloyl-ACP methyl ester carboxylesterase